jgi:hypothetical protein
MLKMYRRRDNGTVSQRMISDPKVLLIQYVDKIHDPARMARDMLERLVYERLRHRVSEIPKTHG